MPTKLLEPYIQRPSIAYFSMEIGLHSDMSTYSGGLGVLAGDTLYSAADLELPLVGVTLISHKGYFRQEIDPNGRQVEHPDHWDTKQLCKQLRVKICVPVEGRDVWVQAWLYVIEGGLGFQIPVLLLDTDLEENTPEDQELTHYLYGGGKDYRLKQEIVLGIGGVRILQALGFNIHTYHLNEGHSALLALELLWRTGKSNHNSNGEGPTYDVSRVKDLCIFTTHTPVEAGIDQFDYTLLNRLLGDYVDMEVVKKLAGEEKFNMTRLALNLSGYVNGVAKSHAKLSSSMFPGYRVHSITNGIHSPTWTASSFQKLYDRCFPEWRHEPEILVRADQIPNDEIWHAHVEAKQKLIEKVRSLTNVQLDPDVPIIGFARRMTAYKRVTLLFHDLDRLREIAERHPLQIIMAGKAHPQDEPGKRMIEDIHRYMEQLGDGIKCVFLPNYNIELGLAMISGSDIWLNTPQRPMEASGTSGMKAAQNGVPNLSILDGWWVEGCIENVTGWAIGTQDLPDIDQEDAASLYDKLDELILPLFYSDRSGWIAIMKGAIAKNAYYFNSHRMMRRYAAEAYIR